ncbi:MAG: hypothetical protein LBC85_01210, partial [Fibromonadaceae bacterium]|nr:hypothetical protein [Fibromonadaceae bacterium]
HPETEYKDYVRKNIRFKYGPIDEGVGFGVEIFSGYGIFTGGLSNNYTNYIPFGATFEIYYKKFEFSPRVYLPIIPNKAKKDFAYSTGIYEEDKGMMQTMIHEASLGYAILNNNSFKISPFFGIAKIDIEPSKIDELKEISLNTFTCVTGLNLGIKIYDPYANAKTSGGFLLNLRYKYAKLNFSRKYDISGGMHLMTIGISLFAKEPKREY